MDEQEREQQIRRIAEQVAARLRRDWPSGQTHINEIEDLAERVGREAMEEITREVVRDQSERKHPNQQECACGAAARYRGAYSLTLVTKHGRVPCRRAYYYCGVCQQGHCPLDREWGLGRGHTTPGVQDLIAGLAALVSYGQVRSILRRVGQPVHLGTRTVELITQAVGQQVELRPPPGPTASGRPIAAAVDGVMVPTRTGKREARCGVVYEPEWNPARTPAAEAELRKEYVATLSSREDLVAEVCRRVERRRPDPKTRVGALGDGAAWIWEGYAAHLPHRVEILDFYHVMAHVWEVARVRYGAGSEAAVAWVRRIKKNLLRYGPGTLLRSLREWRPETEEAKETRRQELGYFAGNQGRMEYPAYLRQGLPIGSGAVEGACKHLVADRFRGAGMRWKGETAEPLLHLRAALLTHPNLDLRSYAGQGEATGPGHAPPALTCHAQPPGAASRLPASLPAPPHRQPMRHATAA